MSARRARLVRRVLVALDASPESAAAAAAAARLAAALEADLAGLFVEDRELLRLAAAPVAHQVSLLTAVEQPVDGAELERQLRTQAARAESGLSRQARRRGIAYSFRVTRGGVASEVLAAAGEGDLVIVGRAGWSYRRPGLGSTARALLERRPAATLLTGRMGELAPPVAVVYDGGEAAAGALRLAAAVAGREPGALRVLVPDAAARRRAARQLGAAAGDACFETLPRATPEALAAAVAAPRAGLLVLPQGGGARDAEALERLLALLPCPLLVVH